MSTVISRDKMGRATTFVDDDGVTKKAIAWEKKAEGRYLVTLSEPMPSGPAGSGSTAPVSPVSLPPRRFASAEEAAGDLLSIPRISPPDEEMPKGPTISVDSRAASAPFGARALASFATNPNQEAQIYREGLEREGYLVATGEHNGKKVTLLRPPGKDWRLADPDRFDIGDVTADVAGELPEAIGGAAGGLASATSPLSLLYGPALAGAGTGVGNAVRQAVADKASGMPVSIDAKDLLSSAAFGAAGEGAGRGLKSFGEWGAAKILRGGTPAKTEVNEGVRRGAQRLQEVDPTFEVDPGQLGVPRGRELEAVEANHPQFAQDYETRLARQENQLDNGVQSMTGKAAPAHELGEQAGEAIRAAKQSNREVLNKRYTEVESLLHDSPPMRAEAINQLRANLGNMLNDLGLTPRRLADGTIDVPIAGFGEGQVKTRIDPGVANKIRSFYMDSALWKKGATPNYGELNRLRESLGALMDDPKALYVEAEEAVLGQAYDAFKEAQRGYLTTSGVAALKKADDLFMANREQLKLLSRVAQGGQEQNILHVFNNKGAPAIAALKSKLTEAGKPELFESLRQSWLRTAFDNSRTYAEFEKSLERLGSGVRADYFSDPLVNELRDVAYLRDAIKGSRARAVRPGAGEGRTVTSRFTEGFWDWFDGQRLALYRNEGEAAELAAKIMSDKGIEADRKIRLIGILAKVNDVANKGPVKALPTAGRFGAQAVHDKVSSPDFEVDERGRYIVNIRHPNIVDAPLSVPSMK